MDFEPCTSDDYKTAFDSISEILQANFGTPALEDGHENPEYIECVMNFLAKNYENEQHKPECYDDLTGVDFATLYLANKMRDSLALKLMSLKPNNCITSSNNID